MPNGSSISPRVAESSSGNCMAAATLEEAERAMRDAELAAESEQRMEQIRLGSTSFQEGSARAVTPPRSVGMQEAARTALGEISPGIGLDGEARAAQRAELARVREAVRKEVARVGVRNSVSAATGSRWFRHWREAASPSRGGSRDSFAAAAVGVGPAAALEEGWQQRMLGANSPPDESVASSSSRARDSPMNVQVAELARREQQLRARQERQNNAGSVPVNHTPPQMSALLIASEQICEARTSLILRRWLRACRRDSVWWRVELHNERAGHAATLSKLEASEAKRQNADKNRWELKEDEMDSMSEAELDQAQKAMEHSIDRIKGELKLRMHREMEKMRLERDQTLCMACCDAEKGMLLTPCNHICVCEACSRQLEKCPICMSPIEARVKVYL